MKFSIIPLGAVLYLFSSVEASISTTNPFKGITWNGGDTKTVSWNDDGKAPKLPEIGLTTVELMVGGSENQVFADSIGKVLATAGEIDYTVPKDVGPAGDFYFIKYTAGDNVFFSGSFTIANVNGVIAGFDPNNPNAKNATPSASTTPSPASPSTGVASNTDITSSPAATQDTNPTGSTQDPNATASGNTPASDSTTSPKSLPSELSSASNNLLPSFVGVATSAIALTLTYLY